ncbi:CLUMA_CG014835, isoform A [Clunio marinus]|uniref:CLUMA_CG014835, isoform A n=1 Tax=Clunio marinus TaxID=568069 RepID=A0A1J1IR68_9DIPT|nr:CLUMA_CG014835, isoform A [Clunio marinus]
MEPGSYRLVNRYDSYTNPMAQTLRPMKQICIVFLMYLSNVYLKLITAYQNLLTIPDEQEKI